MTVQKISFCLTAELSYEKYQHQENRPKKPVVTSKVYALAHVISVKPYGLTLGSLVEKKSTATALATTTSEDERRQSRFYMDNPLTESNKEHMPMCMISYLDKFIFCVILVTVK